MQTKHISSHISLTFHTPHPQLVPDVVRRRRVAKSLQPLQRDQLCSGTPADLTMDPRRHSLLPGLQRVISIPTGRVIGHHGWGCNPLFVFLPMGTRETRHHEGDPSSRSKVFGCPQRFAEVSGAVARDTEDLQNRGENCGGHHCVGRCFYFVANRIHSRHWNSLLRRGGHCQ